VKITRMFKKEPGQGRIKAHFDVEAEIPGIGTVIIPDWSYVDGQKGEFIGVPQKPGKEQGKYFDMLKFEVKEDKWRITNKMLPFVQAAFNGQEVHPDVAKVLAEDDDSIPF